MVGRVYNIAKLTSSPSKIYFEGDVLVSGDNLSLRSPEQFTPDPFGRVRERRDLVLRLTDDAGLRLLKTVTHPGYEYSDFICYSVFEMKKIRIKDYREVVDDLRHLNFLSLRKGISNVLTALSSQFSIVLTDMPQLFNEKMVNLVNISEVKLGEDSLLGKCRDRKILTKYNTTGEVRRQTDASFKFSDSALIVMFDNQLVANDLHRFFSNSIPVTLIRYPGAL